MAHLLKSRLTGRSINAHRAFHRAFFNVLSDAAKLPENIWRRLPGAMNTGRAGAR